MLAHPDPNDVIDRLGLQLPGSSQRVWVMEDKKRTIADCLHVYAHPTLCHSFIISAICPAQLPSWVSFCAHGYSVTTHSLMPIFPFALVRPTLTLENLAALGLRCRATSLHSWK